MVKHVVKELIMDLEFLEENGLREVSEAIMAQGRGSVFNTDEGVSEGLLREFYQALKVVDQEYALIARYKLNGRKYQLSSLNRSLILEISHGGLDGILKEDGLKMLSPQSWSKE
ncbi:hypothetical protein QQ045_026116 [Rhodiola kirilowii]